jgi:PAS domain S-box-containing protein
MQDSAQGRVKWNGLSVPAEVDLPEHLEPHASFLDEVRTGLAGHPGVIGGQDANTGISRRPASKRLRRAFSEAEDADIPVLRVAPDGTLLYANRVGTEFLKRSGCRFGEHIPSELCGLFPEVLRTGGEEDVELRSDGKRALFTVMKRPVTVGGEIPLQRPQGPARGHPGLLKMRALETLPVFFYVIGASDSKGEDWASPGARDITGFSPKEFVSDPALWESRLHPEDAGRAADALRRALSAGSFKVEYRWRRADGRYEWFLDQGVQVFLGRDRGRCIAGARIEITSRRAAESSRLDSGEFLESLVESVSDGVFLAGEDARYVFLSSSYERLIGIRREEWVRGNAALAVHPDDRRAVIDGISRSAGGDRCQRHARVRIASGRYIDVSLRFSPFGWKGRRLALAVVNCTNHV